MGAADAQKIVDQAVEDVRLGFYDEVQGLGLARVTELLAIAYTENATTAAALQRTRANSVEVAWVRYLLMQRMPLILMDAGHVTQEMWNEEGISRHHLTKAELARLEQEILEGLAALRSDAEGQASVQYVVVDPEVLPDVPGQSIFPIVRT